MVKFRAKNCLMAFRNLVRSLNCFNSTCCSQKVEMLSDATLEKIDALQNQLESVLRDVHLLKQNSPRPSLDEEEEKEKDPVFI